MPMPRAKLVYQITTALLSALMLMSCGMYIFNHGEVSATFERLGYPSYIVYPLAVLKLLGLLAIWTRKSQTLREWAYAGFFYDFVLAAVAHMAVDDGESIPAIIATGLLLASYIADQKNQSNMSTV